MKREEKRRKEERKEEREGSVSFLLQFKAAVLRNAHHQLLPRIGINYLQQSHVRVFAHNLKNCATCVCTYVCLKISSQRRAARSGERHSYYVAICHIFIHF